MTDRSKRLITLGEPQKDPLRHIDFSPVHHYDEDVEFVSDFQPKRKGNDQVRFELAYYYFNPKIKIIAPWRDWDFSSRSDLIKYAKKNNIPVPSDKKGAPPFSVDDNLFHTSTEGKILEDPSKQAPEFIFQRTVSPEKAPNKPSYVTIGFKNGDAISINNKKCSPSKLLTLLNNIGGKNGVGRVDLVENRFIGIKSRGVYETPGGTILLPR